MTTPTVAEWAERWLVEFEPPAYRTWRNYNGVLRRFTAEYGDRRLASFDRSEARKLAATLPRYTVNVLRAMFNDALDVGAVRTNPFARLGLPTPRGRRDLDALTEPEIVELADAALKAFDNGVGDTMRAWILTAGFTGIRPGESYQLRPLDLKGDVLTIRGTKTGSARRRVVVTPAVLEALTPLCEAEAARKREPFEPVRIFLTERGRPFTMSTLNRHFARVRDVAGRPELVPYALRHAAATNWLLRGLEPWVIARLLGHSDHGKLVMELYGHPEEQNALDRVRAAYA